MVPPALPVPGVLLKLESLPALLTDPTNTRWARDVAVRPTVLAPPFRTWLDLPPAQTITAPLEVA